MLDAKSVKKSDLKFFDYEKERFPYWLASTGVGIDVYYCYFGPGTVRSGIVEVSSELFTSVGLSNEFGLGVRPVMVLASKIKKDRPPLIEL